MKNSGAFTPWPFGRKQLRSGAVCSPAALWKLHRKCTHVVTVLTNYGRLGFPSGQPSQAQNLTPPPFLDCRMPPPPPVQVETRDMWQNTRRQPPKGMMPVDGVVLKWGHRQDGIMSGLATSCNLQARPFSPSPMGGQPTPPSKRGGKRRTSTYAQKYQPASSFSPDGTHTGPTQYTHNTRGKMALTGLVELILWSWGRKPWSHHPTSRVVLGQWPGSGLECILHWSRGNTGTHPWPVTEGLHQWGATRPEDASVAMQAEPGHLVKMANNPPYTHPKTQTIVLRLARSGHRPGRLVRPQEDLLEGDPRPHRRGRVRSPRRRQERAHAAPVLQVPPAVLPDARGDLPPADLPHHPQGVPEHLPEGGLGLCGVGCGRRCGGVQFDGGRDAAHALSQSLHV